MACNKTHHTQFIPRDETKMMVHFFVLSSFDMHGTDHLDTNTSTIERLLTEEQIQSFVEDGVLVVDHVLSPDQIHCALQGVHDVLKQHNVPTKFLTTRNSSSSTTVLQLEDCNDDEEAESMARGLQSLSSTNGSGGVLDVFYEPFQVEMIATNHALFQMTTQLWHASVTQHGETRNDLLKSEQFKWHPFEAFDPSSGYSYLDRLGFRLPTQQAERLGMVLQKSKANGGEGCVKKKKKKKTASIQRSLTPHLDCCPEDRFRDIQKWRPIQCFVSLTDNLERDTGGFEAAKGFHRIFDSWAQNRPPTQITNRTGNQNDTISVTAPCVGEYTHIRPKEDRDVMDRIQHIPVRAGSAVFWDNRIPHANAYHHNGLYPRCVVYTSFLPDIALNRQYIQQQLENMKRGQQPSDTWIQSTRVEKGCYDLTTKLRPIQRCLLGLDPWDKVHASTS